MWAWYSFGKPYTITNWVGLVFIWVSFYLRAMKEFDICSAEINFPNDNFMPKAELGKLIFLLFQNI